MNVEPLALRTPMMDHRINFVVYVKVFSESMMFDSIQVRFPQRSKSLLCLSRSPFSLLGITVGRQLMGSHTLQS